MSQPSSPASPALTVSGSTTPTPASSEDALRGMLRSALQSLNRREPLDTTYKRLLMGNTLTRRSPVIPKDKFYSRIGSRLRERVETYVQEMQGKDPFDRISQRKPLDEGAMRAAFTLREAKEHEQEPLLSATLASTQMDPKRKRHLDGIALGLQEKKKIRSMTPPPSAKEQTDRARHQAELDRQRDQAQKWEEARRRREEEEARRREEELNRKKNQVETPQQALHKIIEPVFEKYWNMVFVNLGGTNPFRIVIDRENCASIGAPDYFDVITIPMNLTYIQVRVQNFQLTPLKNQSYFLVMTQDKVKKLQYDTLQAFFADVDLMISNAITYNSDPGNPYRVAAEEMKKRHVKIQRKVWQQIPKKS